MTTVPSIRRSLLLAVTIFVVGFSSVSIGAQTTAVDPTFVPVPSIGFTNDDISGKGIVVQPDGKPVIWGGNFAVDGRAKGQIARLNVDGTVDNAFTYCGCLLDSLTSVLVQPDGKLLLAGSSGVVAKVARLNADGSLDSSFVSGVNTSGAPYSSATLLSILPDGRLLVDVYYSLGSGYHQRFVSRLLANGSTDPGFSVINYDFGRLITTWLTAIAVDPAGKMYVATSTSSGPSTSSLFRRYNSDGTQDSSWETPSFAPGNFWISGLAVQPNGSVVVGGRFDSVNGLSKVNFVRLAPAGNVDPDFTAPIFASNGGQVAVLQNGKILVTYNAAGVLGLARLKPDGSLDDSFAQSATVNALSSKWALDSMERILFLGVSNTLNYRYFRLNPNGDEDLTFNPNVTLFGKVQALARQADGKIILAGRFIQVNGVVRNSIARVNTDGTLDTSFDPGTGFDLPPTRLVIQADGKIIAVGSFNSFNGTPRLRIARLNTNGSLDTGFTPVVADFNYVRAVSLQLDGKILIAGTITSVNGTSRAGAARLETSGELDNSFNPVFGSPDLSEIFEQADGKIMVGGSFSGVNGFNRSGMVRLNNNGTLDQTLTATGLGGVDRIWRQPDGKYLVTGTTIRRRNSDGTADSSFVSPELNTSSSSGSSVDTVVIEADGSLIVGGRFDSVNGSYRPNLIRLTANGTVDPLFVATGASGPVRTSVRQPDGKIVFGGEFTRIDNVTRSGIARMSIAPYRISTPFDFDGDGRADVAVYRPSTGVWYQLFSSGIPYGSPTFGIAGDVPVPADFDGDGRTDLAIFRPSTGTWWYRVSSTGQLRAASGALAGDIPLPADINNDGTDDFVIFRPSTNTWHRTTTTGINDSMAFGLTGDVPVMGDFDGDGKADRAVFRPSTGDWWYAASSAGNQHRSIHWGATGDIPAPADFDGDGKTDFAVFRPSNGGWYVFRSSDSSYTILSFGLDGDRPIPADYDGDGKADIAVFRPSTGVWYLLQSTSGSGGVQWGIASDVAVPGAFRGQ